MGAGRAWYVSRDNSSSFNILIGCRCCYYYYYYYYCCCCCCCGLLQQSLYTFVSNISCIKLSMWYACDQRGIIEFKLWRLTWMDRML